MQSLRRILYKLTERDSKHPLALFNYCDTAVIYQMSQLGQLMKTSPNNLDRRSALIKQLKDAQHNLIDIFMYLVDNVIPEHKVSTDFRLKYPDEIQLDMIHGPIWFGAECLAAGSHIANHEMESFELKPYAVYLSKCISRLRQGLREENQCYDPSLSGQKLTFSERVKELLKAFNRSWTDFEFRYVSIMCSVQTETQHFHQQEVAILFSEATNRALQLKYFNKDMVEMMDPVLMFAIPRLAIIQGLVINSDGPINPHRFSRDTPACFRGYRQLLLRTQELLNYLSESDLMALEKALCSSDGFNAFKGTTSSCSQEHNLVDFSSLTPQPDVSLLEQNISSSDTNASSLHIDSSSMFEPIPVIAELDFTQNNMDTSLTIPQNGTETEENGMVKGNLEEHNHEFAHNTRTETHTEHSPSHVATVPEPAIANHSDLHGSSKNGPIGFESTEDLLHRLFLTISGIADQLQSNYPRDFRAILKHAFALCQSDDDDMMFDNTTSNEELERQSSSNVFASQRLYDLSLTGIATSSEVSSHWVADSDSHDCHRCHQKFSFFRRKHHCRSCGQVVCGECSPHSLPVNKQQSPQEESQKHVRVCSICYIEELGKATKQLTNRSSNGLVYSVA